MNVLYCSDLNLNVSILYVHKCCFSFWITRELRSRYSSCQCAVIVHSQCWLIEVLLQFLDDQKSKQTAKEGVKRPQVIPVLDMASSISQNSQSSQRSNSFSQAGSKSAAQKALEKEQRRLKFPVPPEAAINFRPSVGNELFEHAMKLSAEKKNRSNHMHTQAKSATVSTTQPSSAFALASMGPADFAIPTLHNTLPSTTSVESSHKEEDMEHSPSASNTEDGNKHLHGEKGFTEPEQSALDSKQKKSKVQKAGVQSRDTSDLKRNDNRAAPVFNNGQGTLQTGDGKSDNGFSPSKEPASMREKNHQKSTSNSKLTDESNTDPSWLRVIDQAKEAVPKEGKLSSHTILFSRDSRYPSLQGFASQKNLQYKVRSNWQHDAIEPSYTAKFKTVSKSRIGPHLSFKTIKSNPTNQKDSKVTTVQTKKHQEESQYPNEHRSHAFEDSTKLDKAKSFKVPSEGDLTGLQSKENASDPPKGLQELARQPITLSAPRLDQLATATAGSHSFGSPGSAMIEPTVHALQSVVAKQSKIPTTRAIPDLMHDSWLPKLSKTNPIAATGNRFLMIS